MQLLIEFGANPCLEDKSGESAIVWATRGPLKNLDMLELILETAKCFSPDKLPNSAWLEEKVNDLVNYATPEEQNNVINLVQKYYTDFMSG